ncbi:MAG: hypothetical protein M3361_17280 [Candidatus Tectomicrobia bacterium]|nr:hypothetical protein [Candidatus Tectomicrobia bacterium]
MSYIIDVMQGIEEPKDNLAAEKIALFRTYLYTEGTLFIRCGQVQASPVSPGELDEIYTPNIFELVFVDQLNQGLDLAAAAAQTHNAAALKKHFDRNRKKAKQLVDEEGTQGSLYDRARVREEKPTRNVN